MLMSPLLAYWVGSGMGQSPANPTTLGTSAVPVNAPPVVASRPRVREARERRTSMTTASAHQGTRTTPVVGWGIEQSEYDARVARVRRELERRQLSGLVLFHPIRMAYLSGFFHYSTERPMAIVVGQDGGLAALVPHLEQDHIAAIPGVDRVVVYPEYRTGGRS